MWGRIYPHVVLLIFAKIIFKVSCKGGASLTFVIDDTASMYDDISQVKSSVKRISHVVLDEKSCLIGNMVLVTFNDPEASVKVVTENRDTFQRALDAVYVYNYNNLDWWEPSMKGLYLALENSNKDSYIYVFTDAPAKDYRDSHYIKEMCQKKQSQIIFVITGRCYEHHFEPEACDVYFDIAHACSGLAFDVTTDEVGKVLQTIEALACGKKAVITTTIVPPNVYKNIPFTIDDHTEYVIVSVAGKNVYLDIGGPSGSLERIMWNDNGKVVKLYNVKAGQYVARVMGQTRTSVIIVGRTDFFFSHGFSEQIPNSLNDTSLQPIADTKVHLSISVTDDHHTVKIVGAQILDMDEKPIKNLPLKEISKDFYVTDSFVAPSQRFKVAVNGIVLATGKPIKRIGKIPVTPPEKPKKLPDNTKPTTEIAEGKAIEIEYNSTVKLTCKVIAYPKPKISWISNNGSPMPSKTSLVEYPYKYISYMSISSASKGDKYKCYAANDVGRDETTINVVVKEPFTVKSVPSGMTKLVYGKEGTITCDITSRLPIDIHWYYANEMTGQTREIETSDKYKISQSRTQLKIRKMDLDLVGRYECKFFLTNKKDEKKSFFTRVKIDGLTAPKVQGATDLKVMKGKTAVFECKVVRGLPVPKITWLFGGKSGSTFTPITGSENVLRVTNVEDKHEGKYKCVAENVVAKDEHVTTLFVQELPKISSKSSIVYQATEGDALLRIPCVAAGAPKPVFTWKLSGRKITPSTKYSIEKGTLIIKHLKVSDTNSYTCEAKNEVGSVSATFKTYIRQAPQVSGVAAKKVRLGLPASVECSIDQGEPKPTLTWQFMNNAGSKFLPIPGSDKVLIISRVENKHSGRYKCVAQNNVGSSEHITTVVIQDPPKIVSNISTIYQSTEGDALLRIPCVATGLPKASITWKLNGHVINPTAKYSIEDGTLIIRGPKVTDTDSYTCEAKNDAGSVSATFKVYIRQLPKLSGVPLKNVRMGAPVNIECMIVKGEPKPTITWQFLDKNSSKFDPVVGSENVLRITNAEKKQAGRYKCIAQNNVGKDEHVTTLVVEFAPAINSNSSTVEGVVGDLALRIPCDVVGIPPPVITWKLKGVTITPGSKYSIEDGALVIKKPTEKDSSLYTCEAKNYIDSVSASFQAVVEIYPNFGTLHHVYIKKGESKKLNCEAYKSPSQSIKWFTDASNDTIKETYVHIVKASYYDDGNYTCHVSDKHGYTQTHTYVVDVGDEPQLYEETSFESWRGDVTPIMENCDSKSTKPTPVVEWTFNGKPLTDFNSAGVGHYTCNVSNVYGSVQRSFDVKSSACLITRNLRDAQDIPLVLNDKGYWRKLNTTEHYTVIEQEDKITLSCPSKKDTSNTFKNFPKKSKLEAFCYKEDTFLVEGKKYKLSYLQCSNSIEPSVIRKKEKCSTETSESIKVGYNVSGFLETYEVCFDHAKNLPVYTRARISSSDKSLSTDYNWFTYPGIGNKKTEGAFTCKDKLSSCCYSKSQLVNAMDFNHGPAKKSTFIDPLNVIPVWLPCNPSKTTWNNINDMVRSQMTVYTGIVAWSGTHTLQQKHGASIPRYLWKVLKFDSEDTMAIVHVNDPTPTDTDIKCKNICTKKDYDWFTVSDEYTYCCSLPDFFKAFDILDTDMEESMAELLNKIERSTVNSRETSPPRVV